MATWIKCSDGGYCNLDVAPFAAVSGSGSTWYIRITNESSNVVRSLYPTYSTEAEALEALRKLINGVEPADLI